MFIYRAESVSSAMVKMVKTARTGAIWVVRNDEEPFEYVMPAMENFLAKKL